MLSNSKLACVCPLRLSARHPDTKEMIFRMFGHPLSHFVLFYLLLCLNHSRDSPVTVYLLTILLTLFLLDMRFLLVFPFLLGRAFTARGPDVPPTSVAPSSGKSSAGPTATVTFGPSSNYVPSLVC